LQGLGPALDLLALLRVRDRVALLVQIAVVADLMPGFDHLLERLGVALRRVAWHVERCGNVMAAQDVEDPRQPAGHAVPALAERAQTVAVRRVGAEPAGLGVDVECERHRHVRILGPIRSHPPIVVTHRTTLCAQAPPC
jgi:hypothetical protein